MTIIQELEVLADHFDCTEIVSPILKNPDFSICSGSSKSFQHHYGDGGLIRHTYEVVNLILAVCAQYPTKKLNQRVLLVSGFYHDYGKIWDYIKVDGVWTSSKHKREIHHISRSAIEFNKIAAKIPNINIDIDAVTHNILSHHGMREWGSPVASHTPEAWILHLCDGLSARIDDAEKFDTLTR